MSLFEHKRAYLLVPVLFALVIGVKGWYDHHERVKKIAQDNALASQTLQVQFSKLPTTHLGRSHLPEPSSDSAVLLLNHKAAAHIAALPKADSEHLAKLNDPLLANTPSSHVVRFSDAIAKNRASQGQTPGWIKSNWVRLNDTIDLDTTSIQKKGSLVLSIS